MSIFKQTAKSSGEAGEFPIPTAGTHPAVLVAIVDLGTHQDEDRVTHRKYSKRLIYLCWELEDTDAEKGGPRFYVGGDYTLSFGERAKLRGLLENWRGKKFDEGEEMDVSTLLGRPCFLQVTHKTTAKGRTVCQVVGASKLPAKVPPITPTHKPYLFEMDGAEESLPALPEWLPYLYGRPLTDKIAESAEWSGQSAAASSAGVGEHPF